MCGEIDIKISQRELIEAGILPEEYKWRQARQSDLNQKKGKVSSEDIGKAEMGLEKGLSTSEVGGVKGFLKRLLDKFKGKGENNGRL